MTDPAALYRTELHSRHCELDPVRADVEELSA